MTLTHLILHIGHHKTGTTALQSALKASSDILTESGILYPAAGSNNKHSTIAPYVMNHVNSASARKLGSSGWLLRAKSARVWHRIVRDVKHAKPETVVLSGEGFWGIHDPDKIAAMHEKFAAISDNVEIVAYLRSPASRFLSALNQRTRMSAGLPFASSSFFKKAITAFDTPDAQKLTLRIFDRKELIGGDIIEDFGKTFLPQLVEPLRHPAADNTNDSVSAEALAVIKELGFPAQQAMRRQDWRNLYKAVRMVRQADATVPGFTRPRLRPEVADAVVAVSTDLPWLRDCHGIEFPDVDYARVGAADALKIGKLTRISDFCPLDQDRFKALKTEVERLLD